MRDMDRRSPLRRRASPIRASSAFLGVLGMGMGSIGTTYSPAMPPSTPATQMPSASDTYLQQLTDDLLNEKRMRKQERSEYEATIRRLEDRLLSGGLQADTDTEKTLHLRQRLTQLTEQYEYRKQETARLQEDVEKIASAREAEKLAALDAQQAANLRIEDLSREVLGLQSKLQNTLNDTLATTLVNETCLAEHIENMLPEIFGLHVADIPATEVEGDIASLQKNPSWNPGDSFTGCVRVLFSDPTAAHLSEGDVILKVADTEVASTVHLQALLALSKPDALLEYRTGPTKKSFIIKPSRPVSISELDCRRLCKLTGGMVSLLSDYKTHNVRVAEQHELEQTERRHLEEMLEREKQQVADLKRALDAAKDLPQATDHTKDMQLVAVNAKISQEKKLLTMRLSRAVDDRSRLEEELKAATAMIAQLESVTVKEGPSDSDNVELHALRARCEELQDANRELSDRQQADLLQSRGAERDVQTESLAEQVRILTEQVGDLTARNTELLNNEEAKNEAFGQLEVEAKSLRMQLDGVLAAKDPSEYVKSRTTSPHRESWQRERFLGEKLITPAMSVVSVRSVPQDGAADLMVMLQEALGNAPGMEAVQHAVQGLSNLGERVAVLCRKVGLLGGRLVEKERRVKELETECWSLKSAAEDLMGRLEDRGKSAAVQAEEELQHAGVLIATQQQKITQLETMLMDVTSTSMNQVAKVEEARQVSPVRNQTPYMPPPPQPFVEVEVIEHHTKVVERSPTYADLTPHCSSVQTPQMTLLPQSSASLCDPPIPVSMPMYAAY